MNCPCVQNFSSGRGVVAVFLILAGFVGPVSAQSTQESILYEVRDLAADVSDNKYEVQDFRSDFNNIFSSGNVPATSWLFKLYQNQQEITRALGGVPSGYSDTPSYYLQSISDTLQQSLGGASSGGPWLKTFLLGSDSDPWYNTYPQFRFLSHGSSTATPPLNTMVFQSLTDFFTYVLGQNIDNNAIATASFDWSDFFTTNSWIRGNSSGNAATRGYKFWNIWLAEAQRRQINALNVAFETNSWYSLTSTNPVQAVASLSDAEETERRTAEFTNSVASIDSFIVASTNNVNDILSEEQAEMQTMYNNDDGLNDLSIGSTDGEVFFQSTIRLASVGQVQSIASQAGISPVGLSSIQWSPSSSSDVMNGIELLSSTMSSVWAWVRNLAILAVGIYWWRRCRSFVFQVGMRNRA